MLNLKFKTPGIPRTGFEYQDLIGIERLIDFFRHPDSYDWIELESENPDVGSLDDVVVARSDGTYELIQVKFTANPEKYFLNWDWLLEKKPKGDSFLAKWANSLKRVAALGPAYTAQLRTNRRADEEFQEALSGRRIDLNRVDKDRRSKLEVELGGSSPAAAFFALFQFCHSEQLIDQLENRLKGRIVPSDTDNSGWLYLRDQARRWATRKLEPEPDGRIRHRHLVQAITKKRSQPISQNFQVPVIYCPPADEFHEAFIERITSSATPTSVLWGTPGRGKSTYLSFIIEELRRTKFPAIRHHYFLSLDDTASDRISFPEIAISLIDQMSAHYPEAVKGLEEVPGNLRQWIAACGSHFSQAGKPFIVIIDGLDHVWRERANIDQMEYLFSYLLPSAPNVHLIVGTQKVTDDQLPYRLVQNVGEGNWIEIPPMDSVAVHQWVVEQHKAGRVTLKDNSQRAGSEIKELGEVGDAFFEISHGHPLHLIYSFEAMVRRGAIFTADEIHLLPTCPDGDIQKYYNGLWVRLSANAKKIVHLVSASDFHWPPSGIRQCVGPIDEIDHLLERRRSGLIPFHGSILTFARERCDHRASFHSILPKVITWLEHEADEYWRWGWLWLMRAINGNDNDLLRNTTRAWVVESLSKGWPDGHIVAILAEAERRAFKRGDYPRTIELRTLKTRVQNGPEYQIENFAGFQESAIRSHNNTQQILNLTDGIVTLTERQIVSLARARSKDTLDILVECVDELQKRIDLWLRLRHRPPDEFVALTKCFFEVQSFLPELDVRPTMNFVRRFGDPNEIFRAFVNSLSRQDRLNKLAELATSLTSSKERLWRLYTQDALVRVVAREGANIGSMFTGSQLSISALMSCWLYYHKAPTNPRVVMPKVQANIVREHYSYGRNEDVERYFHDIFFYTLANALKGRMISSLLPGVSGNDSTGWINRAVDVLEKTALAIADGTAQLRFSTPYYFANSVNPPTGRRPFDAGQAQYNAFRYALLQIAIDLHYLKAPTGKITKLGLDELNTAKLSYHWNEEVWISEQVEWQFDLLDSEAARHTLDAAIIVDSNRVTPLNDRSDKWTELAQFAFLYNLQGADELVLRAASCMVGYGWRKDLWLADVLEAVGAVHEHGAQDGLAWLRTLVPIVEQITVFTDGDETDHVRSKLIKIVARICPDRLPNFYARYIAEDEFRYADETLSAHCNLSDFADPASIALAHTFVERSDLENLHMLREAGNIHAGKLEVEQLRFLGGMPPDREFRASSNSEVGNRDTPPDITQFMPSDFSTLVEGTSIQFSDVEQQREALKRWLVYWKDRGKGIEAIASIRSYFDSAANTWTAEELLDDVFQVSLEVEGKSAAYTWLVNAHIHRHGWQSYWVSSGSHLTEESV